MGARPAIFITGGGKRLGAALCQHFARAGYDIALHYHASEEGALAVRNMVQAAGVLCDLFPHDLADAAGIPALVARVRQAMPQCVALINNASVFDRMPFMDTDEALFDRQFDINFKAPFFLAQAFAREFGKGCVINVIDSEIAHTQGSHFAYLLSKKALADFTVMAARTFGPALRINAVCPGPIDFGEPPDDIMERLRQSAPLKAHATPGAIAEAAHWLIDQAHVTGQLLYVDGGRHTL